MKKLVFAVLAAAFVFASCDNGGMDNEQEDLFSGGNPFVGTWECTIEYWEAYYIFTDNEIARHAKDENGNYRITTRWKYEYNNSILKTLESWTIANSSWSDVIAEYPYDFSENNKFIFEGKELKKISKKTTFP